MQRVIKQCVIGFLFLGLTAGIGAIEITTNKNQVGVREAIAQAGWWDRLFGPRRSGGTRDPLCVLWPSSEDDRLYKTSSQTPLFIWKNAVIDAASNPPKFGLVVTRVEVWRIAKRDSEKIWEQTNIDPNQQQIRYGSGTPPKSGFQSLEVGKTYALRVFYKSQADVKPGQKPIESFLERSFEIATSPP